jgi:NAD-dependent deacetylase
MDTPPYEALAAAMLQAERAVVLTGLRLGWPEDEDLTHARGRWAQRANLDALVTEPERFWEYFYPTASAIAARTATDAHRALARLQQAGAISHVITQAVDHLHTRAGNTGVVEVHGNLLTARCSRCQERYGLPELGPLIAASPDGVPRCTAAGCDFPLRPTGTLWGEPLPGEAVTRAWELAGEADAFFAFDCDLRTVPISLLPSVPLTRNTPVYLIGETPTQYDRYAQIVVRARSREVLPAVADLLLTGHR